MNNSTKLRDTVAWFACWIWRLYLLELKRRITREEESSSRGELKDWKEHQRRSTSSRFISRILPQIVYIVEKLSFCTYKRNATAASRWKRRGAGYFRSGPPNVPGESIQCRKKVLIHRSVLLSIDNGNFGAKEFILLAPGRRTFSTTSSAATSLIIQILIHRSSIHYFLLRLHNRMRTQATCKYTKKQMEIFKLWVKVDPAIARGLMITTVYACTILNSRTTT